MAGSHTRLAGRTTHPLRTAHPPCLGTSSSPRLHGSRSVFWSIGCVSASRSVWSVSTRFRFFVVTPAVRFCPLLNGGFSGNVTALRFSWRVRRSSRLVSKRRHPDGAVEAGHERESPPAHHDTQQPDERPHETSRHSIPRTPERSKSQRGRGRELPVIIGDPAVSLFLSACFESCGKVDAVLVIYADVSIVWFDTWRSLRPRVRTCPRERACEGHSRARRDRLR